MEEIAQAEEEQNLFGSEDDHDEHDRKDPTDDDFKLFTQFQGDDQSSDDAALFESDNDGEQSME